MVRFYKALGVIAGLLLLLVATQQGVFEHVTDGNWVSQFIAEQGNYALLLLWGGGTLFTAIGGPRQVIAFVFGFALGGLYGALFATLTTLTGCLVSFYTARITIRQTLQRRFGCRIDKFEAFLVEKTWLKTLMFRLLPAGSNLLINLLAGATRIPIRGFIIGSTLGYLPQMFIFSFAGAGVGLADEYQFLISISLFIIASLIGAYLYHSRLRQQMSKLMTEK